MNKTGVLLVGVAMVGIMLGLHKAVRTQWAQQSRTIGYKGVFEDDFMSCATMQNIQATLQSLTAVCASPLSIAAILQYSFPVIKSVTLRTGINGIVVVSIKAHEPYLQFTNNYLMTRTDMLIPGKYFNPEIRAQLPSMAVKLVFSEEQGAYTLPRACCKFIHHVPAHLFKEYEVVWNSENDIKLFDRAHPEQVVCITSETVLTSQFFQQYRMITEDIQHAQPVGKGTRKLALKKTQKWIVDARFKNQIVLSPEKRERA